MDLSRDDPNTGRRWGDHGTAQNAIDFALDVARNRNGPEDVLVFLRAWRQGALDEWPEYYAWLALQEAKRGTNRADRNSREL